MSANELRKTYLDKVEPNFLKDSSVNVGLNTLGRLSIQRAGMARKFCQQADFFLIGNLLLEEDLLSLRERDRDERLNGLPTQIGRWSVEEVFVDIGKHASRGLERVVGGLETGFVGAVLESGMAREDGRDVEDDGCLFKRERELRRRLMCERIKPIG